MVHLCAEKIFLSGLQPHHVKEMRSTADNLISALALKSSPMCRLFLSPYDLTPTYKTVHNKFSVKYFLNLVLVDEEDRRYFKQQEIQLYRLDEANSPSTPSLSLVT